MLADFRVDCSVRGGIIGSVFLGQMSYVFASEVLAKLGNPPQSRAANQVHRYDGGHALPYVH